MTRPILYVFSISHYCEKAKWALDYLKIDYEISVLAPGTHVKTAQNLGLGATSVPYLQTQTGVIQGSGAIIDWAEKHSDVATKHLGSENPDVIAIEERLDEKLGVHIRRWFYSEAITEHPELVKPIFLHQLSVWEKLKLSLTWPVIRKLMIQRMDLGKAQGLESFEIVKQELEWIESKLTTPATFLCTAELSRADITAASLLAPLVAPPEHSCSSLMVLPPNAKKQSASLQGRPLWSWVFNLYQAHR